MDFEDIETDMGAFVKFWGLKHNGGLLVKKWGLKWGLFSSFGHGNILKSFTGSSEYFVKKHPIPTLKRYAMTRRRLTRSCITSSRSF